VEFVKPFIMRDIWQFAPAGERTVSWKSDSAWAFAHASLALLPSVFHVISEEIERFTGKEAT
jgi:hypothetical protein